MFKCTALLAVREIVYHNHLGGELNAAKGLIQATKRLATCIVKQFSNSLSAVGRKSGEKIFVKGYYNFSSLNIIFS